MVLSARPENCHLVSLAALSRAKEKKKKKLLTLATPTPPLQPAEEYQGVWYTHVKPYKVPEKEREVLMGVLGRAVEVFESFPSKTEPSCSFRWSNVVTLFLVPFFQGYRPGSPRSLRIWWWWPDSQSPCPAPSLDTTVWCSGLRMAWPWV